MISIMRDSIDIVPIDGSVIIRPSSMTAKRLFTECIADDTSKPFDFHAKNPYTRPLNNITICPLELYPWTSVKAIAWIIKARVGMLNHDPNVCIKNPLKTNSSAMHCNGTRISATMMKASDMRFSMSKEFVRTISMSVMIAYAASVMAAHLKKSIQFQPPLKSNMMKMVCHELFCLQCIMQAKGDP